MIDSCFVLNFDSERTLFFMIGHCLLRPLPAKVTTLSYRHEKDPILVVVGSCRTWFFS
jgi:hypothetical protein